MSNITYRLATTADIGQLITLRVALQVEVAHADPHDPALAAALRPYLSTAIPAQTFISYVAESSNRLVACTGITYHQNPPSVANPTGRSAYLMNFYTLPSHRAQGIATHLLHLCLDHLRRDNITLVSLHALPLGQPIYAAAGFTPNPIEMRLTLT